MVRKIDNHIVIKIPPLIKDKYSVIIDRYQWANFSDYFIHNYRDFKPVIISDSGIPLKYINDLLDLLKPIAYEPLIIRFPEGEKNKNLKVLSRIQERLFNVKISRNSVIIALGGGVTGDLSGFAAATYKRGVPYIQLPTTLISQVDSSIGGKTAVNNKFGKNQIGLFHFPAAVFINLSTLGTLDERHYLDGLAEVIKAGIIGSDRLLKYLDDNFDQIINRDLNSIEFIVKESLQVKKRVVEKDPYESEYREILNFGHTIGHALEIVEKNLLHGEAVAIGMCIESEILYKSGYLAHADVKIIDNIINKYGFTEKLKKGIAIKKIYDYLLHDKKRKTDKIKISCPKNIGRLSSTGERPSIEFDLNTIVDLIKRYR